MLLGFTGNSGLHPQWFFCKKSRETEPKNWKTEKLEIPYVVTMTLWRHCALNKDMKNWAKKSKNSKLRKSWKWGWIKSAKKNHWSYRLFFVRFFGNHVRTICRQTEFFGFLGWVLSNLRLKITQKGRFSWNIYWVLIFFGEKPSKRSICGGKYWVLGK